MAGALRILAYKPAPARQTIGMERLICCEPLELEYLYTYLKEHQVELLDGMVERRDPVALARQQRSQVVLITAFITNVPHVRNLAQRLKKLSPPPLVFVGGPHAEVVPEHFFCSDIDAVFMHNQLPALVEVVQRIGENRDYSDVPGVALAKGGTSLQQQQRTQLDPAKLKRPQRVLFQAQPQRYFYLHYQRCASVKTAFGCHENCSFCFCTKMNGGRFAPRPLSDVIEEIAEVQAQNIFLVDDNFLSSRKRCLDFCELIRKRGLDRTFIAYGDAAFVAKHPDVLEQFQQVGLAGLIVGLESIDDNELLVLNKKSRTSDNIATIKLCRRLDIDLFALFMVDPAWPVSRFRQLAQYVKQQQLVFATFATYTPFPGTTGFASSAKGEGPWWRYDLLRLHQKPKHMSALRYYLWLCYLHMLPGLLPSTRRHLRRRMGWLKLITLSWRSTLVGLEYLLKLWRWR